MIIMAHVGNVKHLNKAPPGFPVGDDIPPDAYLHMIVSKKHHIHPPPGDGVMDEDIEQGSDLSYPHVSFRDCTHLGCRCTDVVFLIFFLIFQAIVLALALYLWRNANLSINDHAEKCKVICNILEVPKTYDSKEPFKCSKTNKYEVKPRMGDKFEIEDFKPLQPCMADCNKHRTFESFGHKCVDQAGNVTIAHQAEEMELDSKLSELSFLGERIGIFGILLGAPVVFSLVIMGMLMFINIVFFLFLILVSFASVMMTTAYIIHLFLKQANEAKPYEDPYPTMSVFFTLGWILFSIYWFFLLFTSVVKKQYKTIHLTRFAANAITCTLIVYVIISFLVLTVVYLLLILLSGAIETNGKLIYEKKKISYERSNAKDVARALLIFTYWWTNHLVIACQHLVVARIVALRSLYGRSTGICSAVGNLFRFHLGTACMASFIFSTFSFIKDIYEAFLRVQSVSCHPFVTSEYDMDYPKGGNCFKPISRVSYIPVCLFCEHYIRGGMKTTLMFLQRHLMNWRSCKHFYIYLHVFIVGTTTIIFTYLSLEHDHNIENMMYSLFLSTIHTYFIAQAAVGLFRMVVDTLFFGYCYDLALNDGRDRPYITNPKFMEFVKNVPKVRSRKAKVAMRKRHIAGKEGEMGDRRGSERAPSERRSVERRVSEAPPRQSIKSAKSSKSRDDEHKPHHKKKKGKGKKKKKKGGSVKGAKGAKGTKGHDGHKKKGSEKKHKKGHKKNKVAPK